MSGISSIVWSIKNNSVTEIDLHEREIGEAGVAAVAEALKLNCSVTNINLCHCHIGFSGPRVIGAALKVNQCVQDIDLSFNDISNSGSIALAEALKLNQTVTHVSLRGNSIGDRGAIAIAVALKVNQSVTNIDLRWNKIKDAGASALAEVLKVNQSVTNIDLEGNYVIHWLLEDIECILKYKLQNSSDTAVFTSPIQHSMQEQVMSAAADPEKNEISISGGVQPDKSLISVKAWFYSLKSDGDWEQTHGTELIDFEIRVNESTRTYHVVAISPENDTKIFDDEIFNSTQYIRLTETFHYWRTEGLYFDSLMEANAFLRIFIDAVSTKSEAVINILQEVESQSTTERAIGANAKKSIISVKAWVYYLDALRGEFDEVVNELVDVEILANEPTQTYRVVAVFPEKDTKIIDSEIFNSTYYNRLTPTFHYWNKYGLYFESLVEAEVFAGVFEDTIGASKSIMSFTQKMESQRTEYIPNVQGGEPRNETQQPLLPLWSQQYQQTLPQVAPISVQKGAEMTTEMERATLSGSSGLNYMDYFTNSIVNDISEVDEHVTISGGSARLNYKDYLANSSEHDINEVDKQSIIDHVASRGRPTQTKRGNKVAGTEAAHRYKYEHLVDDLRQRKDKLTTAEMQALDRAVNGDLRIGPKHWNRGKDNPRSHAASEQQWDKSVKYGMPVNATAAERAMVVMDSIEKAAREDPDYTELCAQIQFERFKDVRTADGVSVLQKWRDQKNFNEISHKARDAFEEIYDTHVDQLAVKMSEARITTAGRVAKNTKVVNDGDLIYNNDGTVNENCRAFRQKWVDKQGRKLNPVVTPPGTQSRSSGPTKVFVPGYTRDDGIYVGDYYRSSPGKSSTEYTSTTSSSAFVASPPNTTAVPVSGYTRSNGKVVSGYTRFTPTSYKSSPESNISNSSSSISNNYSSSSSSFSSSSSSSSSRSNTISVSGYTRSNGTVVKPYTRRAGGRRK